jgi:hypothetical protein
MLVPDVRKEKGNMMRKGFVVVAILAVVSLVARAEDLKKLSLDDPSSAFPKIEADTKVKAEGASSLKITTQWPTTVSLAEVAGPDIENAILGYSAKVKSELDGTAFLEMWVHLGGGQFFSKGMNDVVSQKTDWKTIKTPFTFQKGQKPEKVTLNLVINGKGTVWIDDIVLSKEPLK